MVTRIETIDDAIARMDGTLIALTGWHERQALAEAAQRRTPSPG